MCIYSFSLIIYIHNYVLLTVDDLYINKFKMRALSRINFGNTFSLTTLRRRMNCLQRTSIRSPELLSQNAMRLTGVRAQ